MKRVACKLWRASILVAALATAKAAAAQGSPQDPALAETLFQQGKALMAAHNYDAACPKLAESNQLDPGTGTLLALAICHEAEGKTATAWAEFSEVEREAHKAGQAERERFAGQRVGALASTLSHLTIEVPGDLAKLDGLEVKKDGVLLGAATWGTALPVDPGTHVVEAQAPGRVPWSATVHIAPNGDAQSVRLPSPAPGETSPTAQGPSVPTPPERPEPASSHPTRPLGIVVGAVALASLTAGSLFGVAALSKNASATSLCSPSRCDNPVAVDDSSQARAFADVADVGIGVGIVALALATYFFFESSPSPAVPTSTGWASGMPFVARHPGCGILGCQF